MALTQAPPTLAAVAARTQRGLGYADAFVAGAASILDCPALTGDPEFHAAEKTGVTVRWFGWRA